MIFTKIQCINTHDTYKWMSVTDQFWLISQKDIVCSVLLLACLLVIVLLMMDSHYFHCQYSTSNNSVATIFENKLGLSYSKLRANLVWLGLGCMFWNKKFDLQKFFWPHPDTFQTASRQPPDTLQTPSSL